MQYSSRKWQSSLLSLKGSSLWNNFQSGCIFHNMKSVCVCVGGGGAVPWVTSVQPQEMRLLFHSTECVKINLTQVQLSFPMWAELCSKMFGNAHIKNKTQPNISFIIVSTTNKRMLSWNQFAFYFIWCTKLDKMHKVLKKSSPAYIMKLQWNIHMHM